MFKPGHLHRVNRDEADGQPVYSVDLYYHIKFLPDGNRKLVMTMLGNVAGEAFQEEFELSKEEAPNFGSVASRIAQKYGLPTQTGLIAKNHDEYDQMFADIRSKLEAPEPLPVSAAPAMTVDRYIPGHLHRVNLVATKDRPAFNVDIYYDVVQDPAEGKMLHIELIGQVSGTSFEESFKLHSDTAYNFASVITRAAHKHGIPVNQSLIMRNHKEYDLMFADIRKRLDLRAGDPINLDHLDSDGL